MRGTHWTPEQDAKLHELHGSGLSMGEIAERIGVSRNAAIGRANRLGLKRPMKAHLARWRNNERRAQAALPPPDPAGRPQGFRNATLELERNHCRFPIGDPKDAAFHYCCAKPEIGRPYCVEHEVITHSPALDRPLSKEAWREAQRLLKIERRAA